MLYLTLATLGVTSATTDAASPSCTCECVRTRDVADAVSDAPLALLIRPVHVRPAHQPSQPDDTTPKVGPQMTTAVVTARWRGAVPDTIVLLTYPPCAPTFRTDREYLLLGDVADDGRLHMWNCDTKEATEAGPELERLTRSKAAG